MEGFLQGLLGSFDFMFASPANPIFWVSVMGGLVGAVFRLRHEARRQNLNFRTHVVHSLKNNIDRATKMMFARNTPDRWKREDYIDIFRDRIKNVTDFLTLFSEGSSNIVGRIHARPLTGKILFNKLKKDFGRRRAVEMRKSALRQPVRVKKNIRL